MLTDFLASPATDAVDAHQTPSPNSPPPDKSSSGQGLAGAIAGIVVAILLVSGTLLALCVLFFCLWRRNSKKREAKSQSGFFDNPVYDHLQRKLSKESHAYASMNDTLYQEVRDSGARLQERVQRDDDSGYAELEVKITAPSLSPGGYSEVNPSPSPCSSPYPRSSPSPRGSPSPSPARSLTRTTLIKFNTCHILDTCQVAEEYLDPRPSSTMSRTCDNLLRKATCSLEDLSTEKAISTTSAEADHVYHELEPTTGVCPSVYVFVKTQELSFTSVASLSISGLPPTAAQLIRNLCANTGRLAHTDLYTLVHTIVNFTNCVCVFCRLKEGSQ